MNKNIAVIRGDGIGPEIVAQAIKVLDKIAEIYISFFCSSYTFFCVFEWVQQGNF